MQTRRTTRATRSTALNNENANARPSRTVATRAKPPSKEAAAVGTSRATAATAASRAKTAATKTAIAEGKLDPAAGKRKRSALGEVTVANGKSKGALPDKDKGKAKEVPVTEKVERKVFDGVLLKSKRTMTSTTTTIAAAVRPTNRRTRSGAAHEPVVHLDRPQVLEDVKEGDEYEVKEERHAMMEVDPPPPVIHSRRLSARKPASVIRRTSTRSLRRQPEPAEEEEEDHRVLKKRRTSSDAADEERKVEDELNLDAVDGDGRLALHDGEIAFGAVEADPNGDDWDDLDAEDIDDPQMVSEYVVEIFEYLKEVEVCRSLIFISAH